MLTPALLFVLSACRREDKLGESGVGVDSVAHSDHPTRDSGDSSVDDTGKSPDSVPVDTTRDSVGDTGLSPPSGDLDAGGSSLVVLGETEAARLWFSPPADLNGDGAADLPLHSGPSNSVRVLLGPVRPGLYRYSDGTLEIVGPGSVGSVVAVPADGLLLVGGGDSGSDGTYVVPLPVTTSLDLATVTSQWTSGSPGAAGVDASGDGRADLLLVDFDSDLGAAGAGAAWLIAGPYDLGGDVDEARATIYDTSAQSWMGHSRAMADVDGDGVNDIALGAPEYIPARHWGDGGGRVVVGTDAPFGSVSTDDMFTISGPEFYSFFGWSMSASDMDGDGYGDLVVGAWYTNAVYVLSGPIVSAGSALDASAVIMERGVTHEWFGMALSAPADVSGDGAPDLLVGAYGYPEVEGDPSEDGRVWLANGPFAGTVELEDGVNGRTFHTSQADDYLGSGPLTLDDIDDDGVPDLGASVPQYDTEYEDAGAAFFLSGVYL